MINSEAVIILDSDEEENSKVNDYHSNGVTCYDNEVDDWLNDSVKDIGESFSVGRSSPLLVKQKAAAKAHRTRSLSPIHILSSPSPPPPQQNAQQLSSADWLDPLPPLLQDEFDDMFNWSTHEKEKATSVSRSTSPLSRSASRQASLSPVNDLTFSIGTIISDDDNNNDSDDSLPSTADLLSQVSTRNSQRSTAKRQRWRDVTNDDKISERRKEKRKADTYLEKTSTTLTSTTNIWEWEGLFDDDAAPSLHESNTDDNHCQQQSLSGLSKKATKEKERKLNQEAKKDAQRRKDQAKLEAKQQKEQARRLQKANALRKDRTELVKEMIVVIYDAAFMQSEQGLLLKTVLAEKGSKVVNLSSISSERPGYTLTWRRECKAEWSEAERQFIPFDDGDIRIREEASALIFLTMESLVKIIQQDRVDNWIDAIQHTCPDKQLFLMIEGLEPYYKKKMNWQRRQFASTVMENIIDSDGNSSNGGEDSSKQRSRRKQKNACANWLENGPTRSRIEEVLTYLQLIKDVMLIQTVNDEDSVDWLVALTTDIAKALYHNVNYAGLHKGHGPAKSGVDAQDTWLKMLQEIQQCTPAVAKSIVQEYPNAMALYQQYNQLDTNAADYLLADLEVERSIVTSRDRTVNKFMSKKIHRIFMSDNPNDIIC